MGKVYSSFVRRPLKNWNVETRAVREMDRQKSKPVSAPKHQTTQQLLKDFAKEHTESAASLLKKNETLHSNLAGMVVEPEKMGEIHTAPRPLPENRSKVDDPEFGYLEPESIPKGKCSMRQALTFLTEHQQKPTIYTSRFIADEYKLDHAQVEKVLKYFHTFNVQIPGAETYLSETTATAPTSLGGNPVEQIGSGRGDKKS